MSFFFSWHHHLSLFAYYYILIINYFFFSCNIFWQNYSIFLLYTAKKQDLQSNFLFFLLFYSLETFLNSHTINPSTARIITSCHAYAKRMNTAPKRNSGVSGGIRHASTTQLTNIQNTFMFSLLLFSNIFGNILPLVYLL